jgi:hypothetical protein
MNTFLNSMLVLHGAENNSHLYVSFRQALL